MNDKEIMAIAVFLAWAVTVGVLFWYGSKSK